jgi:hypothetical protein
LKKGFKYDTSGSWYKGNIHVHTTNSDGFLSASEVVAKYAEAGYDFVAITDHRKTFLNGNGSSYPLLVLEGAEWDGHDDYGTDYHVLAIGTSRKIPESGNLMEALEAAREQSALLIWAHPHWCGNTVGEGLRHQFHGMEIYNHSSQIEVGKGYATMHWDAILERDSNFLGFAVDDSHFRPAEPWWGGGWIMVNAPECTKEAILRSLSKGNFYSSQGPLFKTIKQEGKRVRLETSPIRFARLVGPRSRGKWNYVSEVCMVQEFEIPADWGYARLEIEDVSGKLAWTNALFSEV